MEGADVGTILCPPNVDLRRRSRDMDGLRRTGVSSSSRTLAASVSRKTSKERPRKQRGGVSARSCAKSDVSLRAIVPRNARVRLVRGSRGLDPLEEA